MTENDDSIPGLDLRRFARWYRSQGIGDLDEDAEIALLAGGRSNLTFLVSASQGEFVVRRPPLGRVQPTAHDMRREYDVMTALADTDVPVPRTLAFCDDLNVCGTPLYVMERVDGTVYQKADQLAALGSAATREICTAMVDGLVALHSVNPVPIGLGGFGRPAGFLARQVRRWGQQMHGWQTRELPGADHLLETLGDRVQQVPDVSLEAGSAAIIHGDYRLDNLLIREARVEAILDWEMATLGDPLTDLAHLMVSSELRDLVDVPELGDASDADGFLAAEQIVSRYRSSSGRDVDHLDVYLGLAYYKLAAIFEGIHRRYLAGETPGGAFGTVGAAVQPLIDAGCAVIAA